MKGFVHAEEGRLVDGEGRPLQLRGVGLGNWLLPEGYMWKFEAPGPQSPRQIEALIEDLVGPDRTAEFWQKFRSVFITEDDIARIAAEGMNHVRLPINWRVVMEPSGSLIESGFDLIDRLIDWCRIHGLWVVLDLHGAPGGQTGTHIDDSPHGAPELFTEDSYRRLTIELWRAIARRYRDETVVAAYDLLNEPLPNEYQHIYPDRLRGVYVELTAAIRELDPNHAITYEGTHWATNWSIFTEVWDSNSILQFHKYWSAPDRPSIQQYIDVGARLGLPIYMGEGGENHVDWVQTAFQLFDDCGISWNFWPWKKLETWTSPCSVNAPARWHEIVDYGAGRTRKPSPVYAWGRLVELLDAMPIERCTYRPAVISALLRRPPIRIPAVGFGFRGPGESYHASAGLPLAGFRNDDAVTIVRAPDTTAGDLDWNHAGGGRKSAEDGLLVELADGDWVAYEVQTSRPSRIEIRIATQDAGPGVRATVDGVELEIEPVRNGELQGTTSQELGAGRHVLRLVGKRDQVLVQSIEVLMSGPQAE